MNYVLQQVPPPWPGLPPPRFSLYLSSQLQYGVVVVYHRQCAILLGKKRSTHKNSETSASTLTLWPFRGTPVHRGPAGEEECIPEDWYRWAWQVRKAVQPFTCTYIKTQINCSITYCFLSDQLWIYPMPSRSWRRQKEPQTLYLESCICRTPPSAPVHWWRYTCTNGTALYKCNDKSKCPQSVLCLRGMKSIWEEPLLTIRNQSVLLQLK